MHLYHVTSASMPACQDTAGCSRGESHGKILFVSANKGCDTLTRTEPNEARLRLCRLKQMDGLKQDLYLRYTAFHRRFPIAVHNLIVWQEQTLPPNAKQQHNVDPECATLLNAMIPAWPYLGIYVQDQASQWIDKWMDEWISQPANKPTNQSNR